MTDNPQLGRDRGRLIVFEGGDASGKTTQARRLAARLSARFTREPGGTELGELLRSLVLDPHHHVGLRTETLLIAAARAQHVVDVLEPTLAAGTDVVSDRYLASSLAYQGFGSGLDVKAVAAVNEFATGGLTPDLTVLIDVPVELSQARLGLDLDRFEREDEGYHERVRSGYLDLADADPSHWVVIDGSGPLEEVSGLVDEALRTRFAT